MNRPSRRTVLKTAAGIAALGVPIPGAAGEAQAPSTPRFEANDTPKI
jgi:hypothetical protein